MNDIQIALLAGRALRALSERALTILALLMTFALSLWVMYSPTWEREGMAAFFAVFVFLPSIWHDKRRLRSEVSQVQTQNGTQAD